MPIMLQIFVHNAMPTSAILVPPPLQLDTIALSPTLDWERGQARSYGSSSPTKRSHAHSFSCSRLRSPPRHRRHHYASPECTSRDSNTQGRRSRHATGGRGKNKGTNPSFFQGGTAVHGTSACALCLGCHEHKYAKCSASKLWNGGKVCVRRNEQGRLIFVNGLPVCFNFQTLAGCSDASHPS